MNTHALTAAEWAAMISDPVRDNRYQLTGLGPSVVDYLARRRIAGLADTTLDSYERDLARLAILIPHLEPDHVQTRDLEVAIGHWPVASRKRARATFAAYFDHLYADGIIRADPARRLPRYTQKRKLIDPFTTNEREALTTLPHDLRDKALVRILLETGIRKGEALPLRLRDIDLHEHKLGIRRGKGGHARVVPITGRLAQQISELAILDGVDRDDHLWYTRRVNLAGETITRHHQLGPGAFHRWWQRMCDEAGVRYRNAHVCRHTVATTMLRNGVAMERVSKLLGHASIRTTIDEYAHLQVSDLVDDVERVFGQVAE